MSQPPVILTALLDERTHRIATDLRRRFFPPHRNYLDAHLTLAHQLPGDQVARIRAHAAAVAGRREPIPVYVRELIDMGKGTGLRVSTAADRNTAEALQALRRALLAPFAAALAPQDRQPYRRPHLTIQNKVPRETAQRLQRRLQRLFVPWSGTVVGIGAYYYRGGPWELIDNYYFTAGTF